MQNKLYKTCVDNRFEASEEEQRGLVARKVMEAYLMTESHCYCCRLIYICVIKGQEAGINGNKLTIILLHV